MSTDTSFTATSITSKTRSRHLSHKQYAHELKAALDAFQRTREWADLIQNLSKLHKVFIKFKHIHDEFNEAVHSSLSVDAYRHRVLPHTVQVCKVLAMCLTPGRPAGVHLKTIEVYQAVFDNLSRQNLIADLGLWLCGLLPLASFASARVTPVLLKLLKDYIISLGEPCRVALDGLIASLLPCIEEQNTPLYFQGTELLNQLTVNTGLAFFFSAIMRTICSCSHIRISATHYLLLLFKEKRVECVELCKAHETLCIQAWLCVLRDSENVLAKRNVLDLLNAYFPLQPNLLHQLEPNQILLLVHGLLPVMLFREISVNRRIYSWLLNVHTAAPTDLNGTGMKMDASRLSAATDSSSQSPPQSLPSSPMPAPVPASQDADALSVEHVAHTAAAAAAVVVEDGVPVLSSFVEDILVDAFKLYFDRTGDISLVQLSTVPPLTALSQFDAALSSSSQRSHASVIKPISPSQSQSNRSSDRDREATHSARSVSLQLQTGTRLLPVPGLQIFKKLSHFESEHALNTEQYVTAPLNLLKILIDRNEIRASTLIQRLQRHILQYAHSFEPNSMADMNSTNLQIITCFQAVIQSTQLVFAQIDTHDTIQWLRSMLQCKYDEFVQFTAPPPPSLLDQVGSDAVHAALSTAHVDLAHQTQSQSEQTGKKTKKRTDLSIAIPESAHSVAATRSREFGHGANYLNLVKAIELVDFALDFIPIVSHSQDVQVSIAQFELSQTQTQMTTTTTQKTVTVERDVACLVGDVLSKLHTLLVGDTRIQGIRFCLKLLQRLGKRTSHIPMADIASYLQHSVVSIPSLLTSAAQAEPELQTQISQSPRTELSNRLELEVIELNFQLLQTVIQSQHIVVDDDKDGDNAKQEQKNDEFESDIPTHDDVELRDTIRQVLSDQLAFAETCVYTSLSEQIVICGAQIWLKLIHSYAFLPRHRSSCKKITQRLWELIEPSKPSAVNYQIARLMLALANVNYAAVQKVISQSMLSMQNALQHNVSDLAEGYQRFCTLYRIIGEIDALKFYWDETVYIMLAACDDDRPLIHNIATQWLTESLLIPPRILDPMMMELLDASTQTNPISPEIYHYQQWYDPRLASDTLKKLLSIVVSMGPRLIASCSHCPLTNNVVDKLLLQGCYVSTTTPPTQSAQPAPPPTTTTTTIQQMMRGRSFSTSSSSAPSDSMKRMSGHGHSAYQYRLNAHHGQNVADALSVNVALNVHKTSCLYLSEFNCNDYLDVLILVGIKYLRGTVHEDNSSPDVQNAGLRVRTIAIEFLRRLFQQFQHNLRSAKLASNITSTIVHQLSIAIKQKQYLLQIDLLSLLSTLITVTYRRVDPKEIPNKRRAMNEFNTDSKTNVASASDSNHHHQNNNNNTLFIPEPEMFSSQFFRTTIISGIATCCKLRLQDMQIQLYPLKHFLTFCTFACDYIKHGLSDFVIDLFNVLCEEIENNSNMQHIQHLLDGADILLQKLVRNPNEGVQVNEDTDLNAGTWMIQLLTFGLANYPKKASSASHSHNSGEGSSMERPPFLVEAEVKLFRSWPTIMHSLCVAWGRTLADERSSQHASSTKHGVDGGSDDIGGRRNSLLELSILHSTSRQHRKELDEMHIQNIQHQIMQLVMPFFARHTAVVFVAILNNWEKELNTGKVWALNEMQSSAQQLQQALTAVDDNTRTVDEHLVLNYGGHSVLSRHCEQHRNVLDLLNRIIEEVPANVVLITVCEIGIANLNKSEIAGTSVMVRMNECTALHFMYYYMYTCSQQDSVVSSWPSIRRYFELILSQSSSHPMTFLWIVSILQRLIEQIGSLLMNDKQHRKSFIQVTKTVCSKLADVAGHPENYKNTKNVSNVSTRPAGGTGGNEHSYMRMTQFSKYDPMCLPPILFFVPARNHSNDLPPLPDWIQQLLISDRVSAEFASPQPFEVYPPPPPLSLLSAPSTSDLFRESGSRTQEALSHKVYNSQIPRVYSSPTLDVALASMRVLANMCAVFLHQVLKKNWSTPDVALSENDKYDADAIQNILSTVVGNLSHILSLPSNNVHDNQEALSFLNGYASVLSSLSIQQYRSHTFKTYMRDAWTYFMSDKFFVFCDVSTLHHWQWIIGSVIECDKNKLKYELLSSPSASINVFAKHETDVENRAKQLKRLAFVIHAGRRDQYGRYLNQILEKLVESLKIVHATKLYCQVFVCLRVLLTRIDVTNLSPIWPLIITETIRAFETSSDKQLLLSVCKFVDTALILLPQTFQLFKWSFIQDSTVTKLLRRASSSQKERNGAVKDGENTTEDEDVNGKELGLEKEKDLKEREKDASYESLSALMQHSNTSTVFIPHLQLLAKRLEAERKQTQTEEAKDAVDKCDVGMRSGIFGNGLSYNANMKRPILLMRSIRNVSELIPFHRIVSSLHQRQSQTIDVDYKFLDDLIRSDFIESNHFPNPLLQDVRDPSPF